MRVDVGVGVGGGFDGRGEEEEEHDEGEGDENGDGDEAGACGQEGPWEEVEEELVSAKQVGEEPGEALEDSAA